MTAPRNEVLSQEEASFIEERRSRPVSHDWRWYEIISRLVSRIESDAARSAALRKVAEAARAFVTNMDAASADDEVRLDLRVHDVAIKAALADLDRLTKEAT